MTLVLLASADCVEDAGFPSLTVSGAVGAVCDAGSAGDAASGGDVAYAGFHW